jgi:hypothetical protein
MNVSKKNVIPLLVGLALAGCGNRIPSCDEQNIRELVENMIEEHYEALPIAVYSGATMAKVSEIRTITYNADTNTRQCVGGVSITGPASIQTELNKKTEISFSIGPSQKGPGYSVTLEWP